MTSDELADGFQGLFTEAHAQVVALPDGPDKVRLGRLLALFHAAGNAFWQTGADAGVVKPMDGSNKPPQ